MAEYINREEVCKLCDNQKEYCGKEKCPVYKAPAHDVAEVVRCKDCIGKAHWYKNDYGCTICGLGGLFVVEDRDFCSYGERRTNEN